MPVYEYECVPCRTIYEVQQRLSDPPLTTCPQCQGTVARLISAANVTHSQSATRLGSQLADIRRITERNAAGVKQTRGGTNDLLRQAEALSSSMNRAASTRPTNGRTR